MDGFYEFTLQNEASTAITFFDLHFIYINKSKNEFKFFTLKGEEVDRGPYNLSFFLNKVETRDFDFTIDDKKGRLLLCQNPELGYFIYRKIEPVKILNKINSPKVILIEGFGFYREYLKIPENNSNMRKKEILSKYENVYYLKPIISITNNMIYYHSTIKNEILYVDL